MRAIGILALCVAVGTVAGWLGFQLGRGSGVAEERVIPESRFFYASGDAPRRYVSFKGTWALEGPEKSAFEKQVVEYTCTEADQSCTVGEATVFQNGLSVSTNTLAAEWSGTQIILRSSDAMRCRDNIIVVDLQTEDVVSITKDGSSPPTNCVLPPVGKPRKARLISGFDRYFEDKYGKKS